MDRRLIAVLCADIAGYSRLVRADEDGTLAALARHMSEAIEPALARHHGRIFKTTGDGFLAEFGSPVEATNAALEIQRAMGERNRQEPEERRLAFRIGVNLGDVVMQGEDILGDAVNVAARLQTLAAPGAIAVSGAVFEQVRDRLALGWRDLGERELKNISRPVRVYGIDPVAAPRRQPSRPASWRRWALAASAAAAIAIVAGVGAWRTFLEPVVTSGKPSVAVLPLANHSGDPAQDYFSDGVTDEVIGALGRFPSLTVMSLGAVRPYKDRIAKPSEIGRALGVRYIVDGGVRRSDNRLRVAARLTDTAQGALLWSEQFDEPIQDIFAVQDKITQRIANSLVANLTRAEVQRTLAKRPENLDAYDLVLRGRDKLARISRTANREARTMFERAVALDPGYAAAHAGLADAYYEMAQLGWTEFPAEMVDRAENAAHHALSLDRDNIEAHQILGRLYSMLGRHDQALAKADHVLTLNPSDAKSRITRAVALLWLGRIDESIMAFEVGFWLNANQSARAFFAYGLVLYSARRHEDAAGVLEQGAARYPAFVFIHAALAAAYGQLGRPSDAARAGDAVRRLNPFFDISTFGSEFREPTYHDYLADGLRKAGFN